MILESKKTENFTVKQGISIAQWGDLYHHWDALVPTKIIF
jgi:hypothetical protein